MPTFANRPHRGAPIILVALLTAACGSGHRTESIGTTRAALTGGVGPELTQQGAIIAKVTHPTGGSSPDPEVIRDGHMPAPDDPLQPATQEYDTFDTNTPDDAKTDDWIGYAYAGELTFARVLFQEGIHFGDGGWFTNLNVQVRSHGTWTNVAGLTIAPAYQVDDPDFTSYQLDFAPTKGDAVRIEGAPGGSAKFISVAELQVWAAQGTPGAPDQPMLGTDITSMATPIANIMQPTGGGNKDLSIIKQPPVASGLTGQAAFDAEYDTYTGELRTEDWIGYSYAGTQFFGQLVLQAGMHLHDGGWFETLVVQVRQNGHWIPVDGQRFSPAYPLDGSGVDFATYQVDLGAVGGDGIRIFGRPGGSATFVSVASLHVLAGNPCLGKSDGTACNDGDACTDGDLCMGGMCRSGPAYDCGKPDACHLRGVCQRATGLCSSPIVPDVDPADPDPSGHVACDDGNPCTVNDFCRMGTCIPGAPTACSGPNDKYYAPLVNIGSFQGGSVAMDINNDGVVVGTDTHGHGSAGAAWNAGPGYSLAFWWSESQPGIHYIQPVGPNNVMAAVNSSGTFAGTGGTDFMWHWLNVISGSVFDQSSRIVLPGGWANAINDSGQIAGRGYVPALYPGVKVFRWSPTSLDVFDDSKFGGNAYANAMDSRGTIVGSAIRNDNARAAIMTKEPNGLVDLNDIVHGSLADPDGNWQLVEATGVRFDEQTGVRSIIGWGNFGGMPHAYRLRFEPGLGPDLFDLGTLAEFTGPYSYVHIPVPLRENAKGEIVGSFFDIYEAWPHVPFLWTKERGIEKLNDWVAPTSGWRIAAPFAINENRDVVGFGYVGGEARAFKMRLPDRRPCDPLGSGVCRQAMARDPSSGECLPVGQNLEDSVCNDGDPCTAGDKCHAGDCRGTVSDRCESAISVSAAGIVSINDQINAIFSYRNDSTRDVMVPYGDGNFLEADGVRVSAPLPSPPTLFVPGVRAGALVIPLTAGSLSWTVGSSRATVRSDDPRLTPETRAEGEGVTVSMTDADGNDSSSFVVFAHSPSASAASATISDALVNRVVEPTYAFIAAATTGRIDVGDDGATSYRIPIWVPDGVNGVQPSLFISYDSGGIVGSLGPKWSITGLSVIQRCPKTLAQDGVKRPISFSDDVFCLDGQRLRRQTGDPNRVGEFRTERDPFQKISATAEDEGGIATFQVYQPDGRIFYYGRTEASRIVFKGGASPQTFAYYLDKIQDRFGNSILVSYTTQANEFDTVLTSTEAQALLPSSIQWGATDDTPGQREVTFQYEPGSSYDPRLHQRRIAGNTLVSGERLQSISIQGPDGLGGTPVLKQYKFTYDTPSITGERLLTTIQECDAANACKRPTTITWEFGSMSYTRTDLTTSQGITDVPMLDAPTVTNGGGHSLALSNVYRRIIAIDLNRDGRDDIVYRVWDPNCTKWVARLATSSGTFGAPFDLPGAADTDPACPGGAKAPDGTYDYPYTGDLIFSDLDQNGYPDVISVANGHDYLRVLPPATPQTFPISPRMSSYSIYLNNASDPLGYSSSPLTPDNDKNQLVADSPLIAIGDIDGDGYPDIVRPGKGAFGNGELQWYSPHLGTIASIPSIAGGAAISDVAAIDVDGDGIAEIFRMIPGGSEYVQSPTMNFHGVSQFNLLPMAGHPYGPNTGLPFDFAFERWMADLNGDGLIDYASASNAFFPTQVHASMGAGAQFAPGKLFDGSTTDLLSAFQIGAGWRDGLDDGVRVTDFNLDGRDDLVLMGNGADKFGPQRSNIVVLLSDGGGGFIPFTTSIPIGDPSDGGRAASLDPSNNFVGLFVPYARGYRTSAELDINGDGLPDLLQIEGGHLISYVRQGKMPDMVTQIIEGTGHRNDITYAPLGDSSTYTVDSACAAGSVHHDCLVRRRWLTRSIAETSLERPNASQSQTRTYTYTDGILDRGGRGFLGFLRRDIFGPGSRHTSITTDPGFLNLGDGYTYPTALLPGTVRTDVDTPQGPRSHHYRTRDTTFGNIHTSGLNGTSVTVLPSYVADQSFDCASDGAGACSGTSRLLSATNTTKGFDSYGNLTSRSIDYVDSNGAVRQIDSDATTYDAADTTNWLVRLLSKEVSTSTVYNETVSRTTKYVTSRTTQALNSIEIEPTGDESVRLLRTFDRDPRGRVQFVTDGSTFPSHDACNASCGTSCSASCTQNCAGSSDIGECEAGCMAGCMGGCVSTCIATPSVTRRTGYLYEDADGVYVSTTTNPMGQKTREWRHPGYGFLVEVDDPNQLAQTRTYDTFGRVLSETKTTGASMDYSYNDTEDPASVPVGGVDFSVTPDGVETATQQVHLDSLGREVFRTSPIDGSRVTTAWNDYDTFGRLHSKTKATGTPTDPLATVQNTFTTIYDDLDRPISECHLAADGSSQCKTNTFDGLQITRIDESGHTVVRTVDSQDRMATEEANGQKVANFRYGPFGQLEVEQVSGTSITYDVLGRQTSMSRWTPQIRGTSYNAFGDVVGTYKKVRLPVPGAYEEDNIEYGRDDLGRLTSVTGSGMDRHLYWDMTVAGLAGTNSVGKLVDVFDGSNQVHFEYDANGRLFQEEWTLSLFDAPAESVGVMTYLYDPHGRVETQVYPQNLPGGTYRGCEFAYSYDPYVGSVSSISMLGFPLWTAAERNDLGQVTSEELKSWGGSSMSRSSIYYLPTGQLKSQTLHGNGVQQAQEAYTYYSDGQPSTFGMSGVGGNWSEAYGYDDLDRLTSWTAASGAPTVSYTYDWNGNVSERKWSGETVTYANFNPAGRVTTVSQGGVVVGTDVYAQDAWARIFDTPAATFTYDANDEVISAIEKTNGNQVDHFIHDGLGNRLATTYGTSSGGSFLLTLMDDAYEFKFDHNTGFYEERCRLRANGKVVGDQIRTARDVFATTTFYMTNNVGSVVAEASNTGAVTARARRDPYGNVLDNAMTPYLGPDPTGANPDGSSRLGFGDHERESNLGVVDMRARFYSPRLGGFISADSVIAHANEGRDYYPFVYTWGNPVALADPTGHAPGDGPQSGGDVNASYAEDGGGQAAGSAGGAAAPRGGQCETVPMSRAEATPSADPAVLMTPVVPAPATPASTDATGATQSSSNPLTGANEGFRTSTGGGMCSKNGDGSTAPSNLGTTLADGDGKLVTGLGLQVGAGVGVNSGYVSVSLVADGEREGFAFTVGAGAGTPVGEKVGITISAPAMACTSVGGISGLDGMSITTNVDTPVGSGSGSFSLSSECVSAGPGTGTQWGYTGGTSWTATAALPAGTGQFMLDRLSD